MDNRIIPVALVAGVALLICIAFPMRDQRNVQFSQGPDGKFAIRIRINSHEEVINPYYCPQDYTYHYFLPGSFCGQTIYNDTYDGNLSIDGKKIGRRDKFEWKEGVTYHVNNNGAEDIVRISAGSGIPVIFISSGAEKMGEFDGKEYSQVEKAEIIESDGRITYSGGMSIKCRGNSTYDFDKKAFNIKLDYKAGIFGMPEDRNWVLLANAWDYSYMNNKLAFDMASTSGLRFTPRCEYSDVYVDGNYWGLYLVTEKTEVETNRIEITDLDKKNQRANPQTVISEAETFDQGDKRGVLLDNDPGDITGGYLLERDYRFDKEYGSSRKMTTSYFETKGMHTPIGIKSPEFASKKEVDYICDLISEMEQAITSPDGYSDSGKYYLDYIDLDSWVKWYMIAEIAYDSDKDVTNTLIYKDADKKDPLIYMGPVWDYDNRFGGSVNSPSPLVLSKLEHDGWLADAGWCRYLYDKNEFHDAVLREWKGFFRNYLQNDAMDNIDKWQDKISKSVRCDNIRWYRGEGYNKKWPTEDGEFSDKYSFEEEVSYLKGWIDMRREYLDCYWNEKSYE